MALSVALPLSGLDTESFTTFDVFGQLKSILTSVPQASPSPTASSESSGLGSLGSIPPSPHDNDKALFAVKSPVPEVSVQYGGRDILDWRTNTDYKGWNFRFAHLPENNPAVFFQNRSQYHRLSDFVEEEFEMETCKMCGFQRIVA